MNYIYKIIIGDREYLISRTEAQKLEQYFHDWYRLENSGMIQFITLNDIMITTRAEHLTSLLQIPDYC